MKAFSAPGKALIAGGYLVLDKQFASYVVALSSRMHAVVEGAHTAPEESNTVITVKSPQFLEGEWSFVFDHSSETFTVSEVLGRKNPFVEYSILTMLKFINPQFASKIDITIFSDSGYHSQENVTVKKSQSKQFAYHTAKITDVPKTGLGSSAGLVTVLTTALYSFYISSADVTEKQHLESIHKLAQVAHCQAQGKVGSGFDVAAATFGSIVYRRFDPSLINELKSGVNKSEDSQQIQDLVKQDWNIRNDRVALPSGIRLIMGDVKGGSNTPKLVQKVLKWRAEDPESSEIYSDLNTNNMKLVDSLSEITKAEQDDHFSYAESLKQIGNLNTYEILKSTNASIKPFQDLIKATLEIRKNLQIITQRSGAEIEPPQQTQLLDRCNEIKGVLSSVVPGAGGHDAISLLIEANALENLVQAKKEDTIFDKVEWLDLTEQEYGIIIENVDSYKEFL
ncbi:hypothetical protein WICPIJ_002818 [Wickerhamomyces pijperi]|uniref:Phosphomevalonate kinase n=1 Tax=Wickerhamomyces pijperi TaxID=599730 RepID=A0A9P8Q8A3_WICPI|nr:hypothetical protein WICPIJ_002818 [Wickerhamomyces pijperi]